MTVYTLPDLAYDPAALEPHLDGRILELHHGKHHAAYVKGANATLERLADAREKNDFTAISQLQKDLAFHVSGHVLHSMFWRNLSPEGGGRPTGELEAALLESLGSFERFQAQMERAALAVQGSGWGALAWEPLAGRLAVEQIHDHQDNSCSGTLPLLVLDMWEHAFYLQYQNRKDEWVRAYWNLVDWDDVTRRLERVRGLDLALT